MSFLDNIEQTFSTMKEELLKYFGEYAHIHNVVGEAKARVLEHAANAFGEDDSPDVASPAQTEEQGNVATASNVETSSNSSTEQLIDPTQAV